MVPIIRESNILKTIRNSLKTRKVSFKNNELYEFLMVHPNYPSLASIHDTLSFYGLEVEAYKIENDDIINIPKGSICHLYVKDGEFIIFDKIKNNKVIYFLGNKKVVELLDDFLKKFSGIVLTIENEIKSNKLIEIFSGKNLAYFGMFIIALTIIIFSFSSGWTWFLHQILNFVGSLISLLIVQYNISSTDSLIAKSCSTSKTKINSCNSVLDSKYSKIFGVFSLGNLSLAFFSGLIFWQVIDRSISSIQSFQLLMLLSIPIVLYSIYVQLFRLKSICKYCIAIVLILISHIVIIFCSSELSLQNLHLMNNFLGFFIISLIYMLISTAENLFMEREGRLKNERAFLKIKSQPDYIRYRQSKLQSLETSTKEKPVQLGGNDQNLMTFVYNPFCRPCATTHKDLDKFLNSGNDIGIHLYFYPNSELGIKVADKLIQIYLNEKEDLFKEILKDWFEIGYSEPNLWLNQQRKYDKELSFEMLNNHIQYCKENEIKFTPAIFYNRTLLPEEYKIMDMIYLS